MYEDYLIETLERVNNVTMVDLPLSKKDKVRALMNITMPVSLDNTFYEKQDAFLQEELKKKKILRRRNNSVGISALTSAEFPF